MSFGTHPVLDVVCQRDTQGGEFHTATFEEFTPAYLHWKTKQALFETVLLRELIAIWHVLSDHLHADPTAALLHRFMSDLLVQINERPIAHALFTHNVALLGKLAQGTIAQQSQQINSSTEWIDLLRQLGLMRTDSDVVVQAHMYSAIWTGFVLVDQFLSQSTKASLQTQCDALVQTIRRTFEPDTLPSADALQNSVAPTLMTFLE